MPLHASYSKRRCFVVSLVLRFEVVEEGSEPLLLGSAFGGLLGWSWPLKLLGFGLEHGDGRVSDFLESCRSRGNLLQAALAEGLETLASGGFA